MLIYWFSQWVVFIACFFLKTTIKGVYYQNITWINFLDVLILNIVSRSYRPWSPVRIFICNGIHLWSIKVAELYLVHKTKYYIFWENVVSIHKTKSYSPGRFIVSRTWITIRKNVRLRLCTWRQKSISGYDVIIQINLLFRVDLIDYSPLFRYLEWSWRSTTMKNHLSVEKMFTICIQFVVKIEVSIKVSRIW